MRLSLILMLCGVFLALPLRAAELEVSVQVPRLDVAEYHRPYVAIWLERPDNSVAATLAVWYDTKMENREGEKWLKDMRQWWRRTGRELQMPVDGVSSATRAPGQHVVKFRQGEAPLGALAAGDYRLMVEAVREVGGREVLTLPFRWPAQALQEVQAKGSAELGEITLRVKP